MILRVVAGSTVIAATGSDRRQIEGLHGLVVRNESNMGIMGSNRTHGNAEVVGTWHPETNALARLAEEAVTQRPQSRLVKSLAGSKVTDDQTDMVKDVMAGRHDSAG